MMDTPTPDLDEFADGVFSSVKAYCDQREAALRDEMRALLEALPKPEAGPTGPPGKDGTDGVNGVDSQVPGPQGERGIAGESGRDGRDGQEGVAGRDALQLHVLEDIDTTRCYRCGTYAKYAGGLVRAFRNTDVLGDGNLEQAGWHVVFNGIATASTDLLKLTDGRAVELKLKPNYLGKFDAQAEYARGDMVTHRGSVWHCNAATSEPPGNGATCWTLAVKGTL